MARASCTAEASEFAVARHLTRVYLHYVGAEMSGLKSRLSPSTVRNRRACHQCEARD